MKMEEITCKACGRTLPTAGNFKKTRWGTYAHVCNACAVKKRRTNVANATAQAIKETHELRLKDFTPRELMEELARRGYEGKLTYTHIETIDITNF